MASEVGEFSKIIKGTFNHSVYCKHSRSTHLEIAYIDFTGQEEKKKLKLLERWSAVKGQYLSLRIEVCNKVEIPWICIWVQYFKVIYLVTCHHCQSSDRAILSARLYDVWYVATPVFKPLGQALTPHLKAGYSWCVFKCSSGPSAVTLTYTSTNETGPCQRRPAGLKLRDCWV